MDTVLVETNQFGGVTRISNEETLKWFSNDESTETLIFLSGRWGLPNGDSWFCNESLAKPWREGEAQRPVMDGSMKLESATPQRFSLTQPVIPNLQITKLHGVAWLSYQDIYNTIEVVGGHFFWPQFNSTSSIDAFQEQLQFLARASQLGRQALSRLSLHKDKVWQKYRCVLGGSKK